VAGCQEITGPSVGERTLAKRLLPNFSYSSFVNLPERGRVKPDTIAMPTSSTLVEAASQPSQPAPPWHEHPDAPSIARVCPPGSFALGCAPLIRLLLIIQMADASNKWGMALTLRPVDRFSLRFEGAECVVGMVFNDVVVDMASVRAALRAGFNENVRHVPLRR
jgi:hypothetical protein